jgi:hypothetical protein
MYWGRCNAQVLRFAQEDSLYLRHELVGTTLDCPDTLEFNR